MPFAIPTLRDLIERARQAFRANLPGTDAWAWPNNIVPSAKVMAGLVHEQFGFIDYIGRQKFALTADGENLDRHGAEIGLARLPAAPARGRVTFTASTALTVETGAILNRSDGGEYRVAVGGSIASAGTLTLDVVSVENGKATVAEAGTGLIAASGVTGTATVAVASGGIVGGADLEGDESFRARILFRKRNPPHGGSAADYVIWASAVPGVTRVFVERLFGGAGTVRVFVLMDEIAAGTSGIPDAGEVARVEAYLDALRPAGAALSVAAPVAKVVNVTIDNLSPDTTAVREAILAELRDAFLRLSRVAGSDTANAGMPYLATPAAFSRSWIWQAVANATGEERHEITSPSADVTLAVGEIATLGTVTFT